MHTEPYTAVMAKLKNNGRERLDGFLPSEFYGITEDERNELERLFAQDYDFQGLSSLLSETEFRGFLRISIAALDRDSDDYVSAVIWCGKAGAMNDAICRLIAGMCNVSIWALGSALSFLSGVTMPRDAVGDYIKALVAVLNKKNVTPVLMLKASAELLRMKGFQPKSTEYIEFANRLQAKDRRVRDAALAEIFAVG